MTPDSLASLPWLPRPPETFTATCLALDPTDPGCWQELVRLAGHFLDLNQLSRLAKLKRLVASQQGSSGLIPFRLGVAAHGSTDFLLPCLAASALRHGLDLEVVVGGYDQAVSEALHPGSTLRNARLDALLLALDHRGLPFSRDPLADEGPDEDAPLRHLELIAAGFQAGSQPPTLIFQTLPPPPEPLLGHLDCRIPATLLRRIAAFNAGLRERVAGGPHLILDVERLAATVGLERWFDPVQWHWAKLPFAPHLLPLYAEHVVRLIAASRGQSRKCLVLDLDNTLWGGVVGDDGLEGIRIGQGDALGEAHLAVQRMALDLNQRGIVLAVCSKNDHDTALLPFRHHPDMLLRESDFAVFMANWNDKATNLASMAAMLDLGVDSLVFLDDNPAERAQVRQALPRVATPELPRDPALIPRWVMAAGYFETTALTAEDRTRAAGYRNRIQLDQIRQQHSGNLDLFLQSLEMRVRFAPFDATSMGRIVQLINKTNQFNLTTRRYSETETS
ncbi:MAG: HAD-IIIC family phosphatase, partial [Magnetococcales bacterium]|nr:HAD-IIIC family phosphatase [Magnetococcales bacterium]